MSDSSTETPRRRRASRERPEAADAAAPGGEDTNTGAPGDSSGASAARDRALPSFNGDSAAAAKRGGGRRRGRTPEARALEVPADRGRARSRSPSASAADRRRARDKARPQANPRDRRGRPRQESDPIASRPRRESSPPPRRARRRELPVTSPDRLPRPPEARRRGGRPLGASGASDGPASVNYWSPELEAVARRTMKQASGYSWMYERMVARAKKWGSFLSILAGVLAGIVGTEGLVSIFTSSGDGSGDGGAPLWAGILTAIIGYSIAVIVVLDNTWKLDVVRSEGLVAQVGFAHLSRSIMYQLALRPSERQDARDFVKGILNEIETMKLSSPTIDGRVKGEYVAKFKDNPIYNPEEQWEDYRFQFQKGWDASDDDFSDDDWAEYSGAEYSDYSYDDSGADDSDESPPLPDYVLAHTRDAGGFNRQGVWQSADGSQEADASPEPFVATSSPKHARGSPPPSPPPIRRAQTRRARRRDNVDVVDADLPAREADRRAPTQATLEKMLAAYEQAAGGGGTPPDGT